MKYQSELIKEIVESRGHEKSSIHYKSECIETWIEETKGAYPKLCEYQSEWLNYINENPIGNFPYETVTNVTEATVNNVVPYEYKSAILKGSTKYRDIDTGDILDTFDETKNLELVTVKMPVLTTSNEDGTKTNILTVNEEVELRGIGDVKDELNLMTGEVAQNIGEIVLDGSESWDEYTSQELTNTRLFYCGVPTNSNINTSKFTMINNRFASLNPNSGGLWNTDVVGLGHGVVNNVFRLRVLKSTANTINELKEYLHSNPVRVQYELAEKSIKTVDLSIQDQDGNTLRKIKPIEGTMHIHSDGTPLKPTITMEIPVEAITQNLASFIKEE